MMATQVHYEWLGISQEEQPPDHYRLLGVPRFESNVDVIREAARLRIEQIRQQPYDAQAEDPRPLMNQVLAARECLVNAESRHSYETRLRAELALQQLSAPEPETPVPSGARTTPEVEAVAPPVSIVEHRAYARPKRKRPASVTKARVAPENGIEIDEEDALNASGSDGLWWKATAAFVLLAAGIGIGKLLDFETGRPPEFQANSPASENIGGAQVEQGGETIGEEPVPVAGVPAGSAAGTEHQAGGAVEADAAQVANAPREELNRTVEEIGTAVAEDGSDPDTSLVAGNTKPQGAKPEADNLGEDTLVVAELAPVDPKAPNAVPVPNDGFEGEVGRNAAGAGEQVGEAVAANDRAGAANLPDEKALSIVRVLPPPLKFPSEAARQEYFGELTAMLEQGIDTRRGSLEAAESHFRAARQIMPDDPRLYDAYGQVLVRFLRYDEATEQFTKSTQLAIPYLPGHLATAWVRLLRRDYEAALPVLTETAAVIEESDGEWPGKSARQQAAHWMGRVVGYFEGPGAGLPGTSEFSEKLTEEVSRTLSPAWLESFEAGRASIAVDRERLLQTIDEASASASVQKTDEKERRAEELTERQLANVDEFEKLQMTAEKWQEWITEQTSEIDAQLEELSDAYTKELDRVQTFSSNIANMQSQMMMWESVAGVPGTSTIRANQEINTRRLQILQLQNQMAEANQRAEAARQQATQVMARRAAAVARFQEATGKILKDSGALKKVEMRLNRQLSGLEDAKETASPKVASLRRRLNSIRTYLDIDFETERKRILSSYHDVDASR